MGYLAAGEAASFDLTFEPRLSELCTAAMILLPFDVPASAMPGAGDPTETEVHLPTFLTYRTHDAYCKYYAYS